MKRLVILSVAIFLVTLVVYAPSLSNGFVNFDDPTSVVGNQHLKKPFLEFGAWAFRTTYFSHWHPLTWLSYRLDYALWGLDPAGYHLSSVLLHAVNSALVVLLAAWLLGYGEERPGRETLVGAGLAGLLFGVHPVHVESVAWISERKDVVYALFWLLALLAYVRYARTPGGRGRAPYYVAALAAFAFSLMGKSMAVTLPAALLVLDWYPLRRFRRGSLLRVGVLEKAPFAALAAAGMYVGYVAQYEAGALEVSQYISVSHKFWVAVRALGLYLRNIVVPVELVPFHPFPYEVDPFSPAYAGSLAAVLAVSAAGLVLIRRAPAVAAAWAFLLVTVSPTLGFVRFGDMFAADRFLYLPMLGFLMLAAGLAARALRGGDARARWAALVVALLLLSAKTAFQTQVWRDSLALWRHAALHYPDNANVLGKLATGLTEAGALQEAVTALDRAIGLDPYDFRYRQHRGDLHMRLGQPRMAEEDYTEAMKLLGSYQGTRGRYAGAEAAARLGQMHFGRARAHEALQDHARAARDYEAAALALPDDFAVQNNLAVIYIRLGRLHDALRAFDRAVELAPTSAGLLYSRGRTRRDVGNVQGALEDFRAAARMGFGPARRELDAFKTLAE